MLGYSISGMEGVACWAIAFLAMEGISVLRASLWHIDYNTAGHNMLILVLTPYATLRFSCKNKLGFAADCETKLVFADYAK